MIQVNFLTDLETGSDSKQLDKPTWNEAELLSPDYYYLFFIGKVYRHGPNFI